MRLSFNPRRLRIFATMVTLGVLLFLAGKPKPATTVDSSARFLSDALSPRTSVEHRGAASIELNSTEPPKNADAKTIEVPNAVENTKITLNNIEEVDAEFRLRNVEKLMALPISRLTELQRDLAIDHILSELPFLVGKGRMHPFDALFAHVKALERKNIKLEDEELKKIETMYAGLYPYSIEIANHELE